MVLPDYTKSMEPTSTCDVDNLQSAEREVLERVLGRPLNPGQRVVITAYAPRDARNESPAATTKAGPLGPHGRVDLFVLEHGVLPEDIEAAIHEALECFRSESAAALVDDRGRIVGTRITIYDVLTYAEDARYPSIIAGILRVAPAQVQATLYFYTQNRDPVLKNYRAALERIARGNPPEVEARLQQSHERLKQKLQEIRQRRGA